MADNNIETRHLLTTEAFTNFDTKFKETVFDRQAPYGYKLVDGVKVAIQEDEADGTDGVTQQRSGDVKNPDDSRNSFVLATNADIEDLFTPEP
jgi:hypothetical protein